MEQTIQRNRQDPGVNRHKLPPHHIAPDPVDLTHRSITMEQTAQSNRQDPGAGVALLPLKVVAPDPVDPEVSETKPPEVPIRSVSPKPRAKRSKGSQGSTPGMLPFRDLTPGPGSNQGNVTGQLPTHGVSPGFDLAQTCDLLRELHRNRQDIHRAEKSMNQRVWAKGARAVCFEYRRLTGRDLKKGEVKDPADRLYGLLLPSGKPAPPPDVF